MKKNYFAVILLSLGLWGTTVFAQGRSELLLEKIGGLQEQIKLISLALNIMTVNGKMLSFPTIGQFMVHLVPIMTNSMLLSHKMDRKKHQNMQGVRVVYHLLA